ARLSLPSLSRRPPRPPLFPYTTLFRSRGGAMTDLTILEGATFCICDELGDLVRDTHGFFTQDTRFLSRLVLRINGERPLLLSSRSEEHTSELQSQSNLVCRLLLEKKNK